MEYNQDEIDEIIRNALREDIGNGDITTRSTVAESGAGKARIIAKETGIIAGVHVASRVFKIYDPSIQAEPLAKDGDKVKEGAVVMNLHGPSRGILTCERVALNFMQRMSGIATITNKYVEAVRGYSVQILDTRKTAPGLRVLDKSAVVFGGGRNHRSGLYDMVLIKENHIVAAGGITRAVAMSRGANKGVAIEVEVRNLQELAVALESKPDRILLDNMPIEEMAKAVKMTNKRVPLEASGNITLESITDVAATGVDFISIGSLTHSVKSLDISLYLE